MKRRQFLTAAAAVGGAIASPLRTGAWQMPQLSRPPADPGRLATDETYWRRVAAQYRVTDSVINLEADYWGMMAIPGTRPFSATSNG